MRRGMIHRLCHFGFLVGLCACWLGGIAVSGVAAQPVAPASPPVQEPENRVIPAGEGVPEAAEKRDGGGVGGVVGCQ